MHEPVTLLGPQHASSDRSSLSALPPDLLEQVRGRVRLLALLLAAGFAVDPVLGLLAWSLVTLAGQPVTVGNVGFMAADGAVALASLGFWWVAGRNRVSPARLHILGLAYEVVICFVVALTVYWQWYVETGKLPPITWVPMVIVLFPLVMPGPPRRMLAAAIVAALTSPLALALLERWGKVRAAPDDYFRTADTSMGIVLHHVHTAPVAPSSRTQQPIPPALDGLILACLAKDPAARPQTARELSLRLARIDGDARWTEESARLWWETHHSTP